MSLHIFNNSQEMIKSVPNKKLFLLEQEQELNKTDLLFAETNLESWKELKEDPFYIGVNDEYRENSYHVYKVLNNSIETDRVSYKGIQIGYDELRGKGYIQDRRFSDSQVSIALKAVTNGTDWQVGYIDSNLPNVNTNFYYISRLEALNKLLENIGGEVRFSVEVSGNKIISKRIDIYKSLSEFKGKRFAYGSKLLNIVKEQENSGLYTALVGQGKGEESGDGWGRKTKFTDVVWSIANGNPVDKPAGQEFVELPERTAIYGYPDGTPRFDIVDFSEVEDPEELLEKTFELLETVSRPKVQFNAVVETAGDMELGETVAIVRPDLDFRYMTRVFKIRRNLLNNLRTEVDFGDCLTKSNLERIKTISGKIESEVVNRFDYVLDAANGKNKNFYTANKPTSGMANGDRWYEEMATGGVKMHKFDGTDWIIEKVSGDLLAGVIDGKSGDLDIINMNANNITTGKFRSGIIENSGIATFGQLEGTKEGLQGEISQTKENLEGEISKADREIRETIDLTKQDIEGNFETTLNEYSQIKDTRDVNRPPSWYQSNYPKKNVREFKRTAVMGIGTSLETYGMLTTEVPWSDESGGDIKQNFQVSDKIYTRSGSGSSWKTWRESPNTHELATSGQTIINGDNITTGKVKDQHGRTVFDLTNGDIRFNHTDGTYTRMGRYGIERFTGSDNRMYHYLISIHTFIYGESSSNARWVQLPNDFKGKQFNVYLAMADSMSVANYNRVLQRFVATKHPNHNIDYTNARVPVIAYKSESLGDGTAPNISNVQGMLMAIY